LVLAPQDVPQMRLCDCALIINPDRRINTDGPASLLSALRARHLRHTCCREQDEGIVMEAPHGRRLAEYRPVRCRTQPRRTNPKRQEPVEVMKNRNQGSPDNNTHTPN
jgi:hypothetical protein